MINIGLVGAGGMGTVHYTSFGHIEGAKISAMVGVSELDRQKAAQWNLPIYERVADMLADQPIDIVDVCSPTFLHYDHIMQALAQRKYVICEKPIALKLADARAIFDAAEQAGVEVYIAQVLQFYKESEALRQLVQSGEYGRPLDAHFMRLTAAPRWAQGGWLFDKGRSGLVPFDLHIHDLDLIVSLFGKPQKHQFTHTGRPEAHYHEHYRFSYEFAQGLTVSAEAGWLNADIPFTARWRVYFENGMVFNEGGVVTAYQFDALPRVLDTEEKVKIPTGINVPPTGTYLTELNHFLSCYAAGKPSPIVPKTQILTVLEILEEIAAG
jgi:predicted dehydrogenase